MYNQYLDENRSEEQEQVAEAAAQETGAKEEAAPAAGLLGGLTERLGKFRIDADTLIVIAVIWFILNEAGEELDTELIIAIGVLLLLGI